MFSSDRRSTASSAPPCAGRVLIVDDERTNLEILARMLQRNHYATVTADCGSEALVLLETSEFDLVLLDVVMPGMNGFECLQQIRQHNQISHLPVIMVTAETDRDTIVEAFRAGANDYVTKPIDREITLARIATHTRLRRSLAALRISEERYALAARGSNDGLWDWDVTHNRVFYSDRWQSLLGVSGTEISDSPEEWLSRIHPDDVEKFRDLVYSIQAGQPLSLNCEMRMLHRDGGYRWMLCRGVCVTNEEGLVYRMAGSLTDITEGKVGDPLTGLPNRLLFVDMVERAIEKAKRHPDSNFAVLFLDIDKFKLINDSLGHQAGDQLLMTIAQRLTTCLRASDAVATASYSSNRPGFVVPGNQLPATVARHAGDEFTILLEGLAEASDVEIVAKRILECVAQPVMLGAQENVPTVSIGWAIGNSATMSADDLLREADTAMYHAKQAGRNRGCGYEPTMQYRATLRLEMERDLRNALAGKQFLLNYQPIVSLSHQKTVGFEALVRWKHPLKGMISPGEFIPTAEEIGLIVPLGWWIAEQAMRQAALWCARYGDAAPYVTINCAVRQLYQSDFLKRFCELIRQIGVPGEKICLEVTEGTLMDRPEVIRPILEGLQSAGVRIAIDDFGTGYSSLAYLHRFPLDLIKIDRSFVSNMSDRDEHCEIIRTIIGLGSSLKLKTIAEGVETEEQLERLREFGCQFVQGYFISHPVSAEAAERFLEKSVPPATGPLFPAIDVSELGPLALPTFNRSTRN